MILLLKHCISLQQYTMFATLRSEITNVSAQVKIDKLEEDFNKSEKREQYEFCSEIYKYLSKRIGKDFIYSEDPNWLEGFVLDTDDIGDICSFQVLIINNIPCEYDVWISKEGLARLKESPTYNLLSSILIEENMNGL